MKRKWIAVFAATVFAFSALTGCKDDKQSSTGGESDISSPTESSATENVSVKLSQNSYTAVEDEIFTLGVTVQPNRYVTWKSSDTKLATVTTGGKVIAKRVGTVTITASAEGASDSCVVTIKPAEKTAVSYIETANESLLLSMAEPTEKQTIVASYITLSGDEEIKAEGKSFTYESADESVATVSANGEVLPVSVGTTEIIVSCDGVAGYVTADVYTAGISTPEEWYTMFETDFALSDRYFLKNDIDFSGYVYDIGRDDGIFSCELNGNFHTVKNVTQWRDKKKKDAAADAYQSLFGSATSGMRLKNISFENIRFTKSNCALICRQFRMHTNDNALHETVISNVFADVLYEKGGNGLFETVTGGNVENVFLRLRRTDGKNFDDSFNGIMERDYLNWGLGTCAFTNVVVFSENGEVKWNKNPSSGEIAEITYLNAYICTTKQNAAYRAYTTLDKSVWTVYPTELPVLNG